MKRKTKRRFRRNPAWLHAFKNYPTSITRLSPGSVQNYLYRMGGRASQYSGDRPVEIPFVLMFNGHLILPFLQEADYFSLPEPDRFFETASVDLEQSRELTAAEQEAFETVRCEQIGGYFTIVPPGVVVGIRFFVVDEAREEAFREDPDYAIALSGLIGVLYAERAISREADITFTYEEDQNEDWYVEKGYVEPHELAGFSDMTGNVDLDELRAYVEENYEIEDYEKEEFLGPPERYR